MTGDFRQGLRDLKYAEGKDFTIEYRYDDWSVNRLADAAAERVRLRVDVIVTVGESATLVAGHATATIPIVATDLAGSGQDRPHSELRASRRQRHGIVEPERRAMGKTTRPPQGSRTARVAHHRRVERDGSGQCLPVRGRSTVPRAALAWKPSISVFVRMGTRTREFHRAARSGRRGCRLLGRCHTEACASDRRLRIDAQAGDGRAIARIRESRRADVANRTRGVGSRRTRTWASGAPGRSATHSRSATAWSSAR